MVLALPVQTVLKVLVQKIVMVQKIPVAQKILAAPYPRRISSPQSSEQAMLVSPWRRATWRVLQLAKWELPTRRQMALPQMPGRRMR
jgi:hypothetical protein